MEFKDINSDNIKIIIPDPIKVELENRSLGIGFIEMKIRKIQYEK
jgi:hypothetical protein